VIEFIHLNEKNTLENDNQCPKTKEKYKKIH